MPLAVFEDQNLMTLLAAQLTLAEGAVLAGACKSLWRVREGVWQKAALGVYAWLPDSTPPWDANRVLRRIRWRPDVDAQLAEMVFLFLLGCRQSASISFVTAEEDTRPDPWGLPPIHAKLDNIFGFHRMLVRDPLRFNRAVKAFVQNAPLQGKVKSNPTRAFYEYMTQTLKLSPRDRASKRKEILRQDMVYYKSWHGPEKVVSPEKTKQELAYRLSLPNPLLRLLK